MMEPGDIVLVVFVATALAIAFVIFVRGTKAAMRRRARAGLRVSPLLKRWLGFSCAYVRNGAVIIEMPSARDTIGLDEIAEVRYRYLTIGGFIAWLEFVDSRGRCVWVECSVDGIEDDVLPSLERRLSGFTRSALAKCVEEGDVEDVCRVWVAA